MSRPLQIGVFLPNWIGDVVMATPALRALRGYVGPQGRIVAIMKPYVGQVLEGTDWVDDHIWFDRRSSDASQGAASLVRQLRALQLDAVLIMTNSFRTAYYAWRAGVPRRVGYVRYGRGPLLTDGLTPPRHGWRLEPISAVDYFLGIVQAIGASSSSPVPELATCPDDESRADSLWKRRGWNDGRPVVVLNTGGAYGAAKQWPEEYFSELALRIVREMGAQVVVNCGPAEREAAARIADQSNSPYVYPLSEEAFGIGLSKAVIRRASLLVSTDSGPRHFGAAFGVPTITLFGSTDPRWSHNYHPQSLDLQRHVPCGPCARRTCPLGHHRCMRDLTVDQVFRAVRAMLPAAAYQRVA
jgi:heptosyltransferase-2